MQEEALNSDSTAADYPALEPSAQRSIDAVAAVVEEPAKACCICGLDVSHSKRSRDRGGRYWCAHCNEFSPAHAKVPGAISCLSCGRETPPPLMTEQMGEPVCQFCNKVYLAEVESRLLHRATVTFDPETQARTIIRQMIIILGWLAGIAVLVTLYHFGLLGIQPRSWVPFQSALYFLGTFAVGTGTSIAVQLVKIGYRKRARLAAYDEMVHSALGHLLALEDDSHATGISEPPQPMRRRVERAVSRAQACAGRGVPGAAEILESLAKKSDASRLIPLLLSQRPGSVDTVARNREIAVLSYLQGDLATATSAVTAILLRAPHDQEAMGRQALICFRNGELEQSKKIFRRVIHLAKEKNSEIDLAAAYCNLGMLHVMLLEWDDGAVRYNQALTIYRRLAQEEGQADCLVNLCLIAYKQKKGPEVEAQFYKAMALNKKCNRKEGIAICCSLLGVILLEKEPPDLKAAERLLNQAVQLNMELGRPGGVATAYGNLGLVRVKRHDLNGARELFVKAQAIYQRISRPKMAAKIQSMLKTVGTMSAARATGK